MSCDRESARDLDLVVFGATGFTGQLVCEYLARTYGTKGRVRWAIAGRSREKLEAVRQSLGAIDQNARDLTILLADSADGAALRALSGRTRVMCSTAGPFARYGSELVAACVDRGTHYCDITGEVQWVSRMIAAHELRARQRGTRIVHACGYDSIPSDLGVLILQQHAREQLGSICRDVTSAVFGRSPGLSGGTFASMLNAFAEAKTDARVREILADPFALCPDPSAPTAPRAEQRGPRYDRALGSFTAPFVMAVANTRIVHRSNALLGFAYGRDFSYNEVMKMGTGPSGATAAGLASAGIAGFQRAATFASVRSWLARVMTKPGDGPTPAQRRGSFFALMFLGQVHGTRVKARFASNGDPGYGETAKMLAESALCLAFDGDKLSAQGGVLTPASAMGMPLLERLRAAGMSIDAWTA